MKPSAPKQPEVAKEGGWGTGSFISTLIWGGLLTVGFYSLIPYLPVKRQLAQRYFCGHPLEYATTTLFLVAIATLLLKAVHLSRERRAIREDQLLNDRQLDRLTDPLERAKAVGERLEKLPAARRRTQLAQRLQDACYYVRGQRSTERLEDHLKYLADLASDRLHESYALVRTITWAIPIIGFLGTVMGITIAIANVTPEQLETSLGDVTSGLAVAFDTTALALTLSLLLVFCSFLVERSEQTILGDVEEYGVKRISVLFPSKARAGTLAEAGTAAAEQLLVQTESLIERQTKLWNDGLETLRARWVASLEGQQAELGGAVRQGVANTLDDHTQQLANVRGEFLSAFQDVSKQLSHAVEDHHTQQRSSQAEFATQLAGVLEQLETSAAARQENYFERIDQFGRSLAENVAAWQSQLQQGSEAVSGQLDELRQQREALLQVVGEEKELARLQSRLVDNLDAIRAAETFEQTLQTLSAAVNVLAARSHSHLKAA